MLSDPSTWILFSFTIFLVTSAKKFWALLTAKLDEYIAQVKDEIANLDQESKNAETSLEKAKSESLKTDSIISNAIHEAAQKAITKRAESKKTLTLFEERLNSQYDNDVAIELKFEKKQLVKHFSAKINQELLSLFEKETFDNNLINLDHLNLKKLFNEKQG